MSPNATDDEIKEAHRRLAFAYHPDRNRGRQDSAERFQQIQEAYEILGDRRNREDYDRSRGFTKEKVHKLPGEVSPPSWTGWASIRELFLRLVKVILPLLVAGLSMSWNGPNRDMAGKGLGSVIFIGLLCIYASKLMSNLAALGIKGSTPIEVPPGFFKGLGWLFLIASFVPIFL